MLPELQNEDTGLDEIDVEQLDTLIADPLAARSAMIRLQQLERDRENVKTTKAAVVASYDAQLARLDQDEKYLRAALEGYVRLFGKTSFPDVGTAYLATSQPKIVIEDPEAFKASLGAMFVREVFDETRAKGYALDQATGEGELVAGAAFVPPGKRLQIRKA